MEIKERRCSTKLSGLRNYSPRKSLGRFCELWKESPWTSECTDLLPKALESGNDRFPQCVAYHNTYPTEWNQLPAADCQKHQGVNWFDCGCT